MQATRYKHDCWVGAIQTRVLVRISQVYMQVNFR